MTTTVLKPNGLPRSIRMIKSADFGAVLSCSRDQAIRAYSDFFSVTAKKTPQVHNVRLGFTVGKHNAHLSVERALVKRLLRESSRQKRLLMLEALQDKSYGLDINFRLKCRLPVCGSNGLTKQARKILLRNDIEKLMKIFITKLSK